MVIRSPGFLGQLWFQIFSPTVSIITSQPTYDGRPWKCPQRIGNLGHLAANKQSTYFLLVQGSGLGSKADVGGVGVVCLGEWGI